MMYEKGGLVYSLIDHNLTKIGVPIKASSIYDRPILTELQKKFEANKEKRLPYKARISSIIEDALRDGVDRTGFQNKLASYGINVLFPQESGRKNIWHYIHETIKPIVYITAPISIKAIQQKEYWIDYRQIMAMMK